MIELSKPKADRVHIKEERASETKEKVTRKKPVDGHLAIVDTLSKPEVDRGPSKEERPSETNEKVTRKKHNRHPGVVDMPSKPKTDGIHTEERASETNQKKTQKPGSEHPARLDMPSNPKVDRVHSEEERAIETKEEPANEIEDQGALYKELFGISQFSEDSEDHSDSEMSSDDVVNVEAKPQKTKRILVPRDKDTNFFGTPSLSPSPPSSPSPAANSIAKGKPPILLEGPYRSLLKRTRVTSSKATNDESWPPKRRRKTPADTDVIIPDVGGSSTKINSPTPEDVDVVIPDVRRSSNEIDSRTPEDIDMIIPDIRRSSSKSSSSTATSSKSRRSITSFLLPEDQEILNEAGFPAVMAVLAKHYGFDVDVAVKTFLATKSIEKTKSVLQHAKEVANSATNALLAKLLNNDDAGSCGDEEPQSIRGRSSSSEKRDQSTSSGRQDQKWSSGSRKVKLRSLQIKPRTLEEIDETDLSNYSPPHVSRAGQFRRLVKQGRREEAIGREQRRASGLFVAQTQAQGYDEDQRQQSSSHIPRSSPSSSPTRNSGHEPMDVDNSDGDDFQQSAVTPHKHQPLDDVSLPVDHPQIFLKRISEGQSTLNEDEDDPVLVKLAQEHRDLVMNVTEENADALRSFEQNNNQDLLRLWSLDWVRQKIADM